MNEETSYDELTEHEKLKIAQYIGIVQGGVVTLAAGGLVYLIYRLAKK